MKNLCLNLGQEINNFTKKWFYPILAILHVLISIKNNGALDRSRTCDLPLRRRLLYPTELQAHNHHASIIVKHKEHKIIIIHKNNISFISAKNLIAPIADRFMNS